MNQLIEEWRRCQLESGPYLLDGDKNLLKYPKKCVFYKTFNEYIQSNDFGLRDTKFNIGLIPIPYMGNIQDSSIFILMSNPGLSNIDYHAEQYNADYNNALKNNLRQEIFDTRFPFVCLNPQFCWHSGFEYWYSKLYSIVKIESKRRKIKFHDTLSIIARSMSVLQLFPYHSTKYRFFNNLYSVKLIKGYVKQVLVKKAVNDQASIVVARGAKYWGLEKQKNIAIYDSPQARSASLSINSEGGKLIMDRLKRLP